MTVKGKLESLSPRTSNKLRHLSITAGPAQRTLGDEHTLGDKCPYLEITKRCNMDHSSFRFGFFHPWYFLAFSPTDVYIYKMIFEWGYKVGNFSC